MSTKNEQAKDEQQAEDQQEVELREQDQEDGDYVKIPKSDHKAIKDQLKRANSEAKQFRERLARYQELGDDPEELQSLIAKASESKHEGGDKGGQDEEVVKEQIQRQLAKQRKELDQKYQTELQQERDQRTQLEKTLENTVLLQQASSIITKHEGKPALLLGKIRESARVVKDGDNFTVRIVDENGETEFNDRGEYATLEDFIVTLKEHEDFGAAFGAPKKSGAGVRNQNDSNASRSKGSEFGDLKRSDMSKSEQHKFVKEHGTEAFFALKP